VDLELDGIGRTVISMPSSARMRAAYVTANSDEALKQEHKGVSIPGVNLLFDTSADAPLGRYVGDVYSLWEERGVVGIVAWERLYRHSADPDQIDKVKWSIVI
jgi:hypothetical protein